MKKNKKYYNTGMPEDSVPNVFSPKVPPVRAVHEDGSIERICLSSTISGCISAAPWGGSDFEDMMLDTNGYKSYPLKVYEFDAKDILDGNLITPKELYEKDWVRDAVVNDEYWVVNQDLKPSRTFIISVREFIEEVEDCISFESQCEMDRLDSLNEDYEYEDFMEGCYTKIIVDEYEVLDESKLTIGTSFRIKLSELDDRILDEDGRLDEDMEDIISQAINSFLILDNYVKIAFIHEDYLIFSTDMPCTLILEDVIKNINNEVDFNLSITA